ncbi:MAG: PEGA domain-containing protein [Methanoregula sp.]
MEKKSLVIGILLLLLLLPCAVTALGNITVSSSPVGASIYVDNENKGITVAPSFTVTNIEAGTRVVVLQLSGYQNFTTNAVVPEGGTYSITATLTPNTPAPTISGISPSYGYNSTYISITSIAGTGFSTSSAPGVVLMKSGQTNITATAVTYSSATSIACNFDITNKEAGYWNVIVTNPDGKSYTLTNGFEIKNSAAAVTLSSITQSSAVTNTTVSISSLAGTGFVASPLPQIVLRRSLYNDLYGSVTSATTTNIIGTFNLTNRDPGSYTVCVINSGADPVCGLSFTITAMTSTANGSVYVKSSPSISKIFLDSVFKGYTPMTLENVTPVTHTVMVRSAGYNDYSESVTVTPGNTSYVSASLVLAPEVTTATTVPQTTVTTVKTTVKSTVKAPTPWPSTTATPASPVSIIAILGAVGVGFIILRKK